MRRKLSKSAMAQWMNCAYGYDQQRNRGIYPIRVGSPLMFGNGCDAGFDALLTGSADPMKVYTDHVATYELGKVTPHLDDWEPELLSEAEIADLTNQSRQFGYKGQDVVSLVSLLLERLIDFEKRRSPDELSDNQYKVLDLACRATLAKKAELIFDAYRRIVLPQIVKTYDVQKWSGSGRLDATVEWKGLGKRIVDNKTSSKEYAADQTEYSLELATYASNEGITAVTYVVAIKKIKKNRIKTCSVCGHIGEGQHKTCNSTKSGDRCGGEWSVTIQPEALIQIIHSELEPEQLAVAVDTEEHIHRAVEAGIFPCNFQNCNRQFGKPCTYKDLRWHGSMAGLEVRKKKLE